MRFGKFKGRPLSSIPDASYLLWLLSLTDLDPGLRYSVQRELERREAGQSQPAAIPDLRPLANDWYRRLAREFHPDHGGTHEGMQAVNRGRELLLEMLEAVA